MEACIQAHCLLHQLFLSTVASGHKNQPPFGSHTQSGSEKLTGNQEEEKMDRDGRGERQDRQMT